MSNDKIITLLLFPGARGENGNENIGSNRINIGHFLCTQWRPANVALVSLAVS